MVGCGVVRFAGPACGVVSGFFSVVGVATACGVAEACGGFWPEGKLLVGFGADVPVFSSAFGCSGVADGFGAFRFGGTDFWTFGDVPGTAPVGDCFGPGVVRFAGLPPVGAGDAPGVPEGFTIGEAPGVPPGFTAGEALGVPEGFTPRRFGGAAFFPAAGTFGEPPGLALAAGNFSPGFTKLGGVCFCPAIGAGEPVAPGEPWPLVKICGVGIGVGFGRSFGTGFC